jgi:benzoyl-CoA reductase/2-hydroxyglutaryl-CoA dehydratase subunit BcrC/BadD/HgdB
MDCVVRGYDDFGGARQERTQRFRKTVDMTDAPDIFFRPQFQTSNVQFLPNKSFKTAPGMIMQAASEYPKTAYPKGRCKYGRKCRNPKCGFQHSTLKCRYGIYCLKAGCPFEHY